MNMQHILQLEVGEKYSDAARLLEKLSRQNGQKCNCEVTARLGFDAWLAFTEWARVGTFEEREEMLSLFSTAFKMFKAYCASDALCCWVFGIAIRLSHWELGDYSEEEGIALKDRAGTIDPFWKRLDLGTATQAEVVNNLSGHGSISVYYGVNPDSTH